MIIQNDIFSLADLATLIFIKLVTSFIYLTLNYTTHRLRLNITLANVLRLVISAFDFAIILVLLFSFVWELCEMAISFSVLRVLFMIVICATSWLVLLQQQEVRSVFIISMFSLFLVLILDLLFYLMHFTYKGPMAALFVVNIAYITCWLVFDLYPKEITSLMERVGERLTWVDPLLSQIPHDALALRNICSFNQGLLNCTFIHTSGGAVNEITVILIGLGLLANLFIGLRLIKKTNGTSVKLYDGFMVQIIINGYDNILTIYDQLKNKQLPKARWYTWIIAVCMGLNFISPSYCMASSVAPEVDTSFTGEQQSPVRQGSDGLVAEGAGGSRLQNATTYARDVSAGVAATGIAGGIHQVRTTIMAPSPQTTEPAVNEPSALEVAADRADYEKARADRLEAELTAVKQSWIYRICPVCLRIPSTSNDAGNN